MLNIDTLIFDVDGTLVDSRHDIVDAMNHAMSGQGLTARDPDLIISHVGTGVEELIRKTLGSKDKAFYGGTYKLFTEYFKENCAKNSVLYPHAIEILEHFSGKKKLVLTNRKTPIAELTFDKLGIRHYFHAILGADDEDCRKPSICPIKRNPLTRDLDLGRALMIGDMDVDVMTGKDSGMKTCWVSYGLGKREDIEPLEPDVIIDDLIELKDIVK